MSCGQHLLGKIQMTSVTVILIFHPAQGAAPLHAQFVLQATHLFTSNCCESCYDCDIRVTMEGQQFAFCFQEIKLESGTRAAETYAEVTYYRSFEQQPGRPVCPWSWASPTDKSGPVQQSRRSAQCHGLWGRQVHNTILIRSHRRV
jgi:hypothetical protein